MGVQAFTPLGNTVVITANVTAPAATQVLGLTLAPNQYRVYNSGNAAVYIGFGTTAAIANTMANASIAGMTIVLGPGCTEVYSIVPNAYFTAVAANACTVYIQPGDGI